MKYRPTHRALPLATLALVSACGHHQAPEAQPSPAIPSAVASTAVLTGAAPTQTEREALYAIWAKEAHPDLATLPESVVVHIGTWACDQMATGDSLAQVQTEAAGLITDPVEAADLVFEAAHGLCPALLP